MSDSMDPFVLFYATEKLQESKSMTKRYSVSNYNILQRMVKNHHKGRDGLIGVEGFTGTHTFLYRTHPETNPRYVDSSEIVFH